MKKRLLIRYGKLLSLMLAILGFSGCSDDGDEEGGGLMLMYGTPPAHFQVKGRIVSSGNWSPVKEIRAVLYDSSVYEGEEHIHSADTVYTDSNGRFTMKIGTWIENRKDLKVVFQDVDGEKNGVFESKEATVTFKRSDLKGGSGMYPGSAEKDLGTVRITPKK